MVFDCTYKLIFHEQLDTNKSERKITSSNNAQSQDSQIGLGAGTQHCTSTKQSKHKDFK